VRLVVYQSRVICRGKTKACFQTLYKRKKKKIFFQKVLDKVLEKIVFSKNLRDRKYCVRVRTPYYGRELKFLGTSTPGYLATCLF